MNAVYNPEVAADKAHERYPKGNGQFEALTLDTAFPETARVFAEKTVAQTREVYDRSKDALEAAVDTMEKSFDAAGQGAVALNRKIMDIAQRNVNSGFDLANSLAGAKNLAEMMELQGAYWRKQFGALAAQAEEVRALSTKVTADTAEPVKAHVTSSMEELRKWSSQLPAPRRNSSRRAARVPALLCATISAARRALVESRRSKAMPNFNYSAGAELFPLIRRYFTKGPVGYKRFTSAAEAIRFAVEELRPDLLRGAYLEVDEERFDAKGIRQLYESDTYPLGRRA